MKKRLIFVCHSIFSNKDSTRYQRAKLLSENYEASIIHCGDIPGDVLANFRTSHRVIKGGILSIIHGVLIIAYLRLFKGYEIIHTQYILNAAVLGYVAKRFFKMAWIYDLWDHPSLEFELNTPIKKIVKRFIYNRVTKKWLSHADLWIIGMHPDVLNSLPAIDNNKIIRTTNGIDRSVIDVINEKYRENELGIEKNSLTVCYAGCVTLERGVSLLIDTLETFKHKRSLRVKLFGVTNDNTLKTIDLFNSKNGGKINYLGFLSHDECIDVIAESDICLCILDTSVLNYRYAYPIKLFEYLAMGKIVIATKTVASSEVIQNGVNGFLVNNDMVSIRESLCEIMKLLEAGQLNEIKKCARETVGKYVWDEINQRLISHIQMRFNTTENRLEK